jgi:hypothetical protein
MDFPITGSELKRIRKLCGYSAREVGQFMAGLGMRPTSARRIYDIEVMREVPLRCATALEKLVGKEVFSKALEYIREKDRELQRHYEKMKQQREERAAMQAKMQEAERNGEGWRTCESSIG